MGEYNLSAPLMQNATRQLLLMHRLGEYSLPKGYMVIADGNLRKDQIGGLFDIPPPTLDRLGECHLQTPDIEAWTEWAIKHSIDSRIIMYLNIKRSAIYTFKPGLKDKFATPRSYEMASYLINEVQDLTKLQLLMASRVGATVAKEFIACLRMKDQLPPISEYIAKPKRTKIPDPKEQ